MMRTLEELLELWGAGRMDARAVDELKELLQHADNRALLAEDWLWTGAICRSLQAQEVSETAVAPAENLRNPLHNFRQVLTLFWEHLAPAPRLAGACAVGILAVLLIAVLWSTWPKPATVADVAVAPSLPDTLPGIPEIAPVIHPAPDVPPALPQVNPQVSLQPPLPLEPPRLDLAQRLPVAQSPSVFAPFPVLYTRLASVTGSALGHLRILEGRVRVRDVGQSDDVLVSAVGRPIDFGDRITTSRRSRAMLDLPGGTQVLLHEESRLEMLITDDEPELVLDFGAIKVSRLETVLPPLKLRTQYLAATLPQGEALLLAGENSSWIGAGEGQVTVVRLSDGETSTLHPDSYVAVTEFWPYQVFPAQTCPMWQNLVRQATGEGYP